MCACVKRGLTHSKALAGARGPHESLIVVKIAKEDFEAYISFTFSIDEKHTRNAVICQSLIFRENYSVTPAR